MKTKIKSINVRYDGLVELEAENGQKWNDHKVRFSIGDTIVITPFMGSVKVQKVEESQNETN